MTKYQRTILAGSLGVILFFVLMGVIGDFDYCEQVILHMSQEQYDSVKQMLTEQNDGREPSERDIAHWWDEHRHEAP